MYRDHSADNIQTWSPEAAKVTFAQRCQNAIDVIKATMAQVEVTTIGMSWGKDSSAVLALSLEAARQIKEETGTSPRVRLLTADTLVENPLQTKLSVRMSNQTIEWAHERNLDVKQIWVTPDPIDNYLAVSYTHLTLPTILRV